MSRKEVIEEADRLGFNVDFQYRTALNTGGRIEVGYVYRNGKQILFCKRMSNTTENEFFLCNEFAEDK